ncbi:MAG: hypothetical protein ACREIP_05950, partial [Alphaproteobacteria bacterium]
AAPAATPAAGAAHGWSALELQLAELGWSKAEIDDTQRCHQIALAHCADHVRADGAPFIERPIGAASMLAAHGAPPLMIQAALLHRLYCEGDLAARGGAAAAPAIRRWLAERTGRWVEETVHACHVAAWADLAAPEGAEEIARYSLSRARALLIRAADAIADSVGAGRNPAAIGEWTRIVAHARAVLPPLGFASLLRELESAPQIIAARPASPNAPRARENSCADALAHARCPYVPRRTLLARLRAAVGGSRGV